MTSDQFGPVSATQRWSWIIAIVTSIVSAAIAGAGLAFSIETRTQQQDAAERQRNDKVAQRERTTMERAAGVVFIKRADLTFAVANYTPYPISEVSLHDLVLDGDESTGDERPTDSLTFTADLPPCSQFLLSYEIVDKIRGGKGPDPTVKFFDSFGQGWKRDDFVIEGSRVKAAVPVRTDAQPHSATHDLSDSQWPSQIAGCDAANSQPRGR